MDGETLTRRSFFLPRMAGPAQSGLPAPDPVLHLVNRITFGVSPRDLMHARELGFEGFIEEQLQPEAIDSRS